MNIEFFQLISGGFITLFSAVIGIVWSKADKAEKISTTNKMLLEHITKTLGKTEDLSERLSSLEASVSVEIKNLSVSIKRLESAILRIHQDGYHRSRRGQ